MELKPIVNETVFNFKQSNQLRGLEGLLVVPEDEFDNQVVAKIVSKRGRGNRHILMHEIASNGLVYDSKKRAAEAVTRLNGESSKLRSKNSKRKK